MLQKLRKEKLYAKNFKCEFYLSSMAFLGYTICKDRIRVDEVKIEVVRVWARRTSTIVIHNFMSFAGYYHSLCRVSPLFHLY